MKTLKAEKEFQELLLKLEETEHPLAKKVANTFRKAEKGYTARFNHTKANKVLRGCLEEAIAGMKYEFVTIKDILL